MRIRIIQKSIRDTDYRRHLDLATGEPVDLVCLGELSTTGCLYQVRRTESLEMVLKSLEKYGFAIMLGLPYRTAAGLFNAYLYYLGGEHQVYHKINLFKQFNEHLIFEPGHQAGLIETDNDRFGVAICYDLRFDDIFRRLKELGATKVFVPACFPRVRISDWRRLLVKRAVDHHMHVIGINAVGDDGVNEFGGSSMVVDPGGQVLVQADETSPTVMIVDL